ncbi:MAG TPA: methionyl-tRNA formyltransferase [Candidatus Uhrbacteria bacterium]|nr:methionyl-tRNA formyltransferase [Candidatus Uhrbacteria bacterium]
MNNNKDAKIIFMGTPEFSVPILGALINNYNVVAVVTQPDKKIGRKQILTAPPVKKIALANKLKVLQPEKIRDNSEFIQHLKALKPDLIVVAAYGFILPKELLDIPKFGAVNVHASLLPKYRGASPIQAALLNGEKETGVTIMLINEKMDEGHLLAQKAITITNDDNFKTLHDKLSILGAHLLIDTLPKYLSSQIKPQKQDDNRATYCKILTKKDGKIDWRKSALEIERQVRALNPWPGTWTTWQNKILKILEVEILNPQINCAESEIGKTFLTKQQALAINCKQGSLILKKLQPEGRKPMAAKEFLNGYQEIIGSILK